MYYLSCWVLLRFTAKSRLPFPGYMITINLPQFVWIWALFCHVHGYMTFGYHGSNRFFINWFLITVLLMWLVLNAVLLCMNVHALKFLYVTQSGCRSWQVRVYANMMRDIILHMFPKQHYPFKPIWTTLCAVVNLFDLTRSYSHTVYIITIMINSGFSRSCPDSYLSIRDDL